MFSKDPDWSNENEYRWVCIPNDPTIEQAFIPIADSGCVLGVIAGDLVGTEGLDALNEFASAFSITANVAQCSWGNPVRFGADVRTR